MRHAAWLAVAALAFSAPALAVSDKDKARVAIGEAKGRIDAADQAGVGDAADIQSRARSAYEAAQREFKDGAKRKAIEAAQEAGSLADLAIATAEMRKLTAERDQLAASH